MSNAHFKKITCDERKSVDRNISPNKYLTKSLAGQHDKCPPENCVIALVITAFSARIDFAD